MNINKDFVYVNSAFESKYSGPLSARWHTFKMALNLLSQGFPGAPVSVLETGCQRMVDDWGGGCSTLIIAEYLHKYMQHDSLLISVDNTIQNLMLSKSVLEAEHLWGPQIQQIHGDSLAVLAEIGAKPKALDTRYAFIYLDSYDCDPENEEVTKASQYHQLMECKLAVELFGDQNPFKILMLDDNNLPWGGKCRLTKEFLADNYWTCLFDFQQTLWIKKNEEFELY